MNQKAKYVKTNWVDKETIITANNMNKLENQVDILTDSLELTNASLEQKPNINDVRMTTLVQPINVREMDTETKLLFTGGAVPVVDENSIGNENLKEKSVKLDNCNFNPIINGKPSINLINKEDVKYGVFIRWDFGDERVPSNPNQWSASKYIKIKSNTRYTINIFGQMAFYDVNKSYISGLNPNALELNKEYTFTTPVTAMYIRVSIDVAYLETIQMEVGTGVHDYRSFGHKIITDNLSDEFTNLFNNKITGITSKNLFNKSNIQNGYYVRHNNGTLGENVDFSVSNFIEIIENTNYSINKFNQVAFYDEYKKYISGVDGFNAGKKTITSPVNARYIRVSIKKLDLDIYQLEKGDKTTNYQKYGLKIKEEDVIFNDKKISQIISSIILADYRIKIKLIGDSIMQGEGGTGFVQDGEEIIPGWNVNTKGYCWANLLKDYYESKFNCEVNNWGTRGRNSNHILQNIDTLVKDDDDIVICMIGTNDRNTGATTLKQLYDNIKSIYKKVTGRGKKIILMSSLPTSVANETGLWGNKDYHMEDVDNIYAKISADLGIEYISLYKKVLEYCDLKDVTIDSLLADGLHPNDKGYDILFKIITTELGIAYKRPLSTW